MGRMRWSGQLLGAPAVAERVAGPARGSARVTGRIVHETVPPVFEYVDDPVAGTTETTVVSPPQYEGVPATVAAYAADHGGRAAVVASVQTDAQGGFLIEGLTESVSLRVVPSSSDWQSGWATVATLSDWPGFASWLQWIRPPEVDVAPGTDLGMVEAVAAVASGRVVDAGSGAPIPAARVRYDPVQHGFKTRLGATDHDGVFSIRGLDYEEYHVRVNAHGYLGGVLGAQFLLYAEGQGSTWPGGPLPGDIRMIKSS